MKYEKADVNSSLNVQANEHTPVQVESQIIVHAHLSSSINFLIFQKIYIYCKKKNSTQNKTSFNENYAYILKSWFDEFVGTFYLLLLLVAL